MVGSKKRGGFLDEETPSLKGETLSFCSFILIGGSYARGKKEG